MDAWVGTRGESGRFRVEYWGIIVCCSLLADCVTLVWSHLSMRVKMGREIEKAKRAL